MAQGFRAAGLLDRSGPGDCGSELPVPTAVFAATLALMTRPHPAASNRCDRLGPPAPVQGVEPDDGTVIEELDGIARQLEEYLRGHGFDGARFSVLRCAG